MRYVRFSHGPGPTLPGVIDGTTVRPFDASVPSLEAFIASSDAERAMAVVDLGKPIPVAEVVLRAPLQPAKNVFCVGRNYLAHAEEGARAQGVALALPSVPTFFTKAPTVIAGPSELLELDSTISPQYDWEAELGVIIGKRCKDVSEADALSVVFGYTCFNDVTARDLQRAHVQWFKGKSLDHTGPLGPWIVDAADIADPQALDIALRVNGVEKQRSNTANMIFSIRTLIAQLSRGMTLEPGDIIASGTPEGVGYARTPPEFLADGDIMDVEIAGIGVLRNAVSITPGSR